MSKSRFLVEAAYAPSTIRRYRDAVSQFLDWCSPTDDPSSPQQFDELLTDYFHHLYETQQGRGKAHATLYGILVHLPHLKDHLHLSSKSLRGWSKRHPPVSYPPLTWELACLISLRLALSGFMHHAIAVLLGFDCFLRVGEIVGLHHEDVADAKDARIGVKSIDMTIRLRATKTGPNQWVIVENPSVKTLLRKLVANTPSGKLIFPFSTQNFRLRFKTACAQLGLSPRYVPHSLRHGGATRWHLLGHPVEDILIRGRWASTKSARRYIQSGRAMLMTMAVPQSLQSLASSVSDDILLLLSLTQSH